uniref:Clip domain-containing protein n=1 Tax=Echinostoma caproni TaxID=27848 RepID=A0A183AFX7_9TREM
LTGYVRRIRLFWQLSGTYLLPPQSTSARSSKNSKSKSEVFRNTSLVVGSSNTTANETQWPDAPTTPVPTYQLLHPDFGIQIRLTSRMLFQGNFSTERKRALCEFFSGFWCPSSQLNSTTRPTENEDLEACVQASMRCDKLPDCNPSVPIDRGHMLSADELNCDLSPFNYSTERQEKLSPNNWRKSTAEKRQSECFVDHKATSKYMWSVGRTRADLVTRQSDRDLDTQVDRPDDSYLIRLGHPIRSRFGLGVTSVHVV